MFRGAVSKIVDVIQRGIYTQSAYALRLEAAPIKAGTTRGGLSTPSGSR
jgi:hypothetical protein